MTVCNLCSKRESRARNFSLPFTSKECEENSKNFSSGLSDDGITYIEGNGKHFKINSETEVDIVTDISTEKAIVFEVDVHNMKEGKPIVIKDYKDALLASLYSQVEHLKSELDEKNLFIRC